MVLSLLLLSQIAGHIAAAQPPTTHLEGEHIEVDNRRFVVDSFINSGGSGEVYQAKEFLDGKPTGTRVAIKFMRKDLAPYVANEIQKLHTNGEDFVRKISHFFLTYDPLVSADGETIIVMPLLKNDLSAELVPHDNHENLLERLRLSTEVFYFFVRALNELLAAGLAHGDIKPANIGRMHDGSLRLFDFDGLQKIGGRTVFYRDYAAPEVQRKHRTNLTSDAYSMAITLADILFSYSFSKTRSIRSSYISRNVEALPNFFQNLREQMRTQNLLTAFDGPITAMELFMTAAVKVHPRERQQSMHLALTEIQKNYLVPNDIYYTVIELKERLQSESEGQNFRQRIANLCRKLF